MSPPPLLIGAALIFWGWQTGLMMAAVPAAAVIEASRWLSLKIDFETRDFRRIGDLCIWIFAGLSGYAVLSTGLPHAVVQVVKLVPFAMFPLIVAQSYSTSSQLNLLALFRLGSGRPDQDTGKGIHSGYPYFVICLLGAAAANSRSPWFFWVVAALGLWALWSVRSPRHSLLSWIVAGILIVGCGYAGQLAVRNAQVALVAATMEWFGGRSTDPYKSTTDIGHIGELKLSDDILVRLFADESITGSLLLHRASYNSYARGVWLVQGAALAPVQPAGTDGFWQLNATVQDAATRHETVEVDTTQVGNRLTIVSRLQAGRGVLPLPSGSRTVEGLVVDELKQNHLGTVGIEKQAPFVRYEVRYRAQAQAGSAAGERDLKIPASESTAITGLAERLNLNQLDTDTAVQIVSDYFHNNFAYSIYQAQSNIGGTPIEVFLEQTRRGHCEYFASATVLLLRAAGVPARYATGYSVQEWSELEQAYIIRQRHAHAWARYYKNGRWHDLDTTPPQWAEIEGEQRSILEPLGDLFSWLRFSFDRWRSGDNDAALSPWWLCALAPLIIYVAYGGYGSANARGQCTHRLQHRLMGTQLPRRRSRLSKPICASAISSAASVSRCSSGLHD